MLQTSIPQSISALYWNCKAAVVTDDGDGDNAHQWPFDSNMIFLEINVRKYGAFPFVCVYLFDPQQQLRWASFLVLYVACPINHFASASVT